MCEPRHLRYSVNHTPPRTGAILIIAPEKKNARLHFLEKFANYIFYMNRKFIRRTESMRIKRAQFPCHRHTYIGQYSHHFPVRHGEALGEIAEGGAGLAIRTSELLIGVDVYMAYLCGFCGYIIADFCENVDSNFKNNNSTC